MSAQDDAADLVSDEIMRAAGVDLEIAAVIADACERVLRIARERKVSPAVSVAYMIAKTQRSLGSSCGDNGTAMASTLVGACMEVLALLERAGFREVHFTVGRDQGKPS